VGDPYCWGIFREETHSPGRESDDAEILRLAAKSLEAKGFQVDLRGPDELGGSPGHMRPRAIFLMCERLPVLRELASWERDGIVAVNRPSAVLDTYRERMIARFAEAAVPFIESRSVATSDERVTALAPVWVKRGDVHNTQEGDVVLANGAAAIARALEGMATRGIPRAVIQPHVDGDLIKFYGIGRREAPADAPPWFRWFYHKGQRLAGHRFDAAALARLVCRAAEALGLEIYGGDCIVTPAGGLVLIDLNAWPSFALYRDEAGLTIGAYLAARFRELIK
jgi:hypothetical protein